MNSKITKKYALWGVLTFVIFLFAFIIIGGSLQYKYGIYGLLMTEFMILLFGLIPAFLLKIPIKKMLVIKKPVLKEFFGTIFLWIGAFILSTFSLIIISYLIPDIYSDVSGNINELLSSVPGIVLFLIIGVSPSICEEIFHRGFLQYTFGGFNKWSKVLIMGIIFGIFHLDPTRFFSTAILGGALTYSYIVTGNFLAPVFIHFLNNFISLIPTLMLSDEALLVAENTENPVSFLVAVSSYLYFVAFVPIIFSYASKLLNKDINIDDYNKQKFIACALTVIIFIIAVILTSISN